MTRADVQGMIGAAASAPAPSLTRADVQAMIDDIPSLTPAEVRAMVGPLPPPSPAAWQTFANQFLGIVAEYVACVDEGAMDYHLEVWHLDGDYDSVLESTLIRLNGCWPDFIPRR